MVGGPSCGKTRMSLKLKDFIENDKKVEVILVNEESIGLNKQELYVDYQTEKILRAKLKSEVEQYLDDKRIVIIDSLNYIKGYRYELYCLVRNFKTRHCTVYLKTQYEVCQSFNSNNLDLPYTEDLLLDLYSRMEEPIQASMIDLNLNR